MKDEKMEEEYEVKKIVNLPTEEIDRIQETINAENLELIEKAYDKHRITSLDRDYLIGFYSDGMGVYREVYRALYESFRRPDRTCAFDPKTGKVERDGNGKPIDYGLKAVTPFTCTRLEYVDKFNNPIYVIFPRMKKASRAIEKLESKYNKDYVKSLQKALDAYFEQEDREAFCEKLQNIPQGNAKLHDILRLTITSKYLSGVERIYRVISENRGQNIFFINEKETRNRFSLPLSKNEKRYYDIKMIMHQRKSNRNLNVEIQLKIQALYEGDLRTHKIYEEVREIEAKLAKERAFTDPVEIRQQEAKIKILNNRIRKINENAIHKYNMLVLDKARRIENDGYRPLRIEPDNIDGTYNQCRQHINKEYLVESYDDFNPQTAFSADNEVNKLCFLRMIGKISSDFDETDENAYKTVNYKFSRLTLAEKERFNGINEIAHRYSSIIQRKILLRKRLEPMETYPVIPTTKERD